VKSILHKLTWIPSVSIIFLVILSCANPKPPSGGEPDKTPPMVIKFYPSNYTTNFRKKNIEISFNKWVDRGSVVNNIFLNPPTKYQVNWSGKTLQIEFPDGLDTNTTYSLLLGTDYLDLDQNKAQEPFSLVFSTGFYIDSAKVIGKVVADDMSGVFVYALPTTEFSDTLVDIERLFHYKTQPNQKGDFNIEAMRESKYYIFAFKDRNNNKVYDNGIDEFGLYSEEYYATSVKADTCIIILSKPSDLTKPQLIDIEGINSRILKSTFSEPILINDSICSEVHIVDTIMQNRIAPSIALLHPIERNVLYLFFDTLMTDNFYRLSISNPDMIVDTIGNYLDYPKELVFKGSSLTDKQKPEPIFKKQFKINTLGEKLDLGFSKPIDAIRSKIYTFAIGIFQKDTIKGIVSFTNPFLATLKFDKLKWNNRYKLILKIDTLLDIYGLGDFNLSLESELLVSEEPVFGNIRGKIMPRSDVIPSNFKIIAFNKSNTYVSEIKSGEWSFDNMLEGTYTLVVFQDTDNDGKYFCGSLNPFKLSEKILIVKPNVQVKRSWTIENIELWIRAR
jgi:hypothetical protein